MAALFRAGKTGEATVNGQSIAMESWTTHYSGENIPTTNFESNGCYQGVTGIRKLAWTLAGQWDANEYPTEDPPGLYPRDDGDTLILTMSTQDAGGNWEMPSFMCDSSSVTTTATGNIKFDSSGSSQGQFRNPSGVLVSATVG